jgi:hypothetical protein
VLGVVEPFVPSLVPCASFPTKLHPFGCSLPPDVNVLPTGREELKTLSLAFNAYKPNKQHWEQDETKHLNQMHSSSRLNLTSLFQLVHKVMQRSRSIWTATPHKIPNQSPCSVQTIPLRMYFNCETENKWKFTYSERKLMRKHNTVPLRWKTKANMDAAGMPTM